jgi:hypothetical protein
MANGTPESFPLRKPVIPVEQTWSRGTVDDKMVPAKLSEPPAAKNIQLEDNTGKWAGFKGDVETTWIRGTTNSKMVTEPPVPKAANIQLEDNVGKWASFKGDIEDTWIRSTTNDKMV